MVGPESRAAGRRKVNLRDKHECCHNGFFGAGEIRDAGSPPGGAAAVATPIAIV